MRASLCRDTHDFCIFSVELDCYLSATSINKMDVEDNGGRSGRNAGANIDSYDNANAREVVVVQSMRGRNFCPATNFRF